MTRVGAVLLAAGRSERFGEANKLLASVGDDPVVRRAARTLVEAPLDERVAVVGHEAKRVREVLPAGFDVRENEAYREGQHTSVREGVEVARERGWDAVVFALGDMPFVAPETVRALRDAFKGGAGTIVAPTYRGERGNPVLFGRSHFGALASADNDEGGRRIVKRHPDAVYIPVEDAGVRRDIDRPNDLSGS